MTSEAILFEVGGWLIMACLALIVVLLFLKLVFKFRPLFDAIDYLSMPGTIIHEFGHYAVCKIYGIQVVKVKWFHWGYMLNYEKALHETKGRAGFVRRARAPNILVQFQVSAAPLLSCGLFWCLSIVGVHLLISEASSLNSTLTPLQETVAVVVLLWVGLAAAARMLPSNADMENVLNWLPTSPLDHLIRLTARLIRGINGLLRKFLEGVQLWSVVTTLTTLYVLLQFSIPGGQAYLESFGIIAVAIRDFAEAAKSIN